MGSIARRKFRCSRRRADCIRRISSLAHASGIGRRCQLSGIGPIGSRAFGCRGPAASAGVHLEDCQSGFRLYPANLLKVVQARYGAGSGFTFESEILINAARAGHGISFVRISVTYPADHMHSTHYDHVRDNARMVKMIAKKLMLRGVDALNPVRLLRRKPRK
jgi:hypothetical protein